MHYPPPVHGAAMVGQYIKESEIINKAFTTEYINLSTSKNVDEIGEQGLVKWQRYFGIIFNTLKSLWFFRPNMVYITLTAKGIGFFKDALLVLLAKVHGKKVIIHFHNKGVQQRQHKTFDNLLYKLVFNNSKVILLAPQLYQDVEKYVDERQVFYCSNGIPEKKVDEKGTEKSVDPVVILFLSNLIISKGVLVLLEACRLLKERGISFHCNVVGGAGDLSEDGFQQKIYDLGVENYVSYLGKKYGDEKHAVFADASIFVLPTFYENECFPLVLLEAMQYGLPLISTNEGGIASIITEGENGSLIKQNDVHGLADTLERFIKDSGLRNNYGHMAKLKFEKYYTLVIFENSLKAILLKAIA